MRTKIITGRVEDALRRLEPGSFHAALCDPPYGLTANKQGGSGPASVNLNHPGGRARITTGFMGMKWDGSIPGPEVWAEVLRVLKPGAPLLAFGGARTFHRLACAIEDAGFIVSDTLCWLYGQGFPKGHAQLKPAWEPIIMAWKKGKRVLAIDECRIPGSAWKAHDAPGLAETKFFTDGNCKVIHKEPHDLGRWPANVILDEESAELLDELSGLLQSGANPRARGADQHRRVYGGWKGAQNFGTRRPTDAGGASRFFYCAKASRKERGEGNSHPTVKPVKLCEYLARLILPPTKDARLLVPFSGSGSEMIGARKAGWKHITGVEMEPAYIKIARRRLAA